jgi:hypothetical protein
MQCSVGAIIYAIDRIDDSLLPCMFVDLLSRSIRGYMMIASSLVVTSLPVLRAYTLSNRAKYLMGLISSLYNIYTYS